MNDYDECLEQIEIAKKGLEALYSLSENQTLVGFLFQNRKGVFKFHTIRDMIKDLDDSINVMKSVDKEEFNNMV